MRILCIVLLWPALLFAEPAVPLRAVVSESNTAPYAIFNAGQVLEAGLSKDIIDELASNLNRHVAYLNLPRSRVEPWLQDGEADVACFLSPDWVSAPDSLQWTEPLFISNVVNMLFNIQFKLTLRLFALISR
uniref:hypothetical protein n=1 Tax=Rheinheimera sp. TaxID=1869214 RepID=UPI0040481D64